MLLGKEMKKCTIHGNGSALRTFIHVYDVSLAVETIMACGVGICQGCTVELNKNNENKDSYREKYALACIDGPIFNAKDIKTCYL